MSEEDNKYGTFLIKEDEVPKRNLYVAARGHVQRVIDVALLINNTSRLATITRRRQEYQLLELYILVSALAASIVAQVVAGVGFFVAHQREINNEPESRKLDYLCYACVGIVMLLNVFIAAFDATWSSSIATEGVANSL